jgi:hypothetical protein
MGNEEHEIKDMFLTPEIRYLEFTHIDDYKKNLKQINSKDYEILYKGVHRIEAEKWIIVIKEKE